jgi:hypothetical protein
MKLIKATVYKDFSDEIGIKFNNKKEFDTYCDEHHPNADDVVINGIAFLGWDEIDIFFHCKNEDEFFELID